MIPAKTLMLANFFGLLFTVMGVGLVIRGNQIREVIDDLAKSKASQLMFGIIPLIVGSAIVSFHSAWRPGLPIAVTILGWIFLVGGIVRFCFTDFWISTMIATRDKVPVRPYGAILAVVGLVFLYYSMGQG